MTAILFGLVVGLLLGFIFGAWFGSENVRRADERLIATLETDRDAARNEAKVFRGLLIPNFARVDTVTRAAEIKAAADNAKPGSIARDPNRRRVPFRKLFNLARQESNQKQIRTDALASALEQVKVPTGEKDNVKH